MFLNEFIIDIKNINTVLSNYISRSLKIGISSFNTSSKHIFEAFKESQKALKALFYKDNEYIASFSELSLFNGSNPYYSKDFEKNLAINLEQRNIAHLQNLINKYLKSIGDCADISSDTVKLNTIEIVNIFTTYLRSLSFSISDIDKEYIYYYQQIAAMTSFTELTKWTREFFAIFSGFLCEINKGVLRTDIIQALKFIQDNYSNEISLVDLAKHVNISKNHLSYLFKKETGETFSDYLNKIRIEKAQELLVSGQYKIHEIAEMVGFHNTGYFSKVFKKSTGSSPLDFKNGGEPYVF